MQNIDYQDAVQIKNDSNFLFNERLSKVKPPIVSLNIKGQIIDSDINSIAVVGSRKMSMYGKEVTKFFVSGLVKAGFTIISGLMYGVDLEAHKSAIDNNGRTIGVLGYGFKTLENTPYARNVANQIINNNLGAVISEFDYEHPATKYTFPQRNRIVASMSKAVLIIEADEHSGSLITADLGLELGKDIFVVPGPIFSSLSKGKHRLIKEGATLVDSPNDILEYYGIDVKKEILKNANGGKIKSTLLEILNVGDSTLDEIINDSKLSFKDVSVMISDLEIDGFIQKVAGNKYSLKH